MQAWRGNGGLLLLSLLLGAMVGVREAGEWGANIGVFLVPALKLLLWRHCWKW